jgi:molecular chaperone GrpE
MNNPETLDPIEELPEEPAAVESEHVESLTTEPNDEGQANDWKDRYLRLASDFDNFRKRTQREKENWMRIANQDLLKALLPIFDDLDRTLVAAESSDNIEAIREGLRLVLKKTRSTLEKQGLVPMQAKGEPFDAEYYEAIAQMPAPSEELKGRVLEVVETGYLYQQEVLRYAKVIIGE